MGIRAYIDAYVFRLYYKKWPKPLRKGKTVVKRTKKPQETPISILEPLVVTPVTTESRSLKIILGNREASPKQLWEGCNHLARLVKGRISASFKPAVGKDGHFYLTTYDPVTFIEGRQDLLWELVNPKYVAIATAEATIRRNGDGICQGVLGTVSVSYSNGTPLPVTKEQVEAVAGVCRARLYEEGQCVKFSVEQDSLANPEEVLCAVAELMGVYILDDPKRRDKDPEAALFPHCDPASAM